eukprot:scaffold86304_cov58-Phaeocystis_antarctica.AAC.8
MTIVSMTETATAAIAAPVLVLSISCGGSGRDSGGGGGGMILDHGNIDDGNRMCTGVLQGWGGELHIMLCCQAVPATCTRTLRVQRRRILVQLSFICKPSSP